jgi:hypothetical protein
MEEIQNVFDCVFKPTPIRPEILRYLVIRGDINDAIEYLKADFFGIKLIQTQSLGDKVLVVDYDTNTMYKTEDGRLIGVYHTFNFPIDMFRLATELYFESLRRLNIQLLPKRVIKDPPTKAGYKIHSE